MDAATLPSNSNLDDPVSADTSGFRSYLVETRAGYASNGGTGIDTRRSSEMGLRTEYRFETLNYGEFVLQADARRHQGDQDVNASSAFGVFNKKSNGRVTFRSLGLPITTNTFADASLGDISSEITDALSRNYRFSLGNHTLRGASTRIFNRESDFRAGVGQLGNMVGGPYPGFEQTQGNAAWLGYSQRFSNKLYAGVQLNQLQDLPVYGSTNLNTHVTTLASSVGYGYELTDDGDYKARATLLGSHTSASVTGLNKGASGLFLEGGYKTGRYRHELGAYTTAANLHFGQYANPVDTRGAYWRMDNSGSRLNWGLGADYERQDSLYAANQPESQRASINFNAQHQIDRNSSIGGNANIGIIRYDNGSYIANNYVGYIPNNGSNSYHASTYYQTQFSGWGRSRLTATMRRNRTLVSNGVAATGEDIAWEQDWVAGKHETMRSEFSTSLGYARDRSDGNDQTYPTAGVNFRYWPDADWSMGGNLYYSSRSGNLSTSRGLSGSLSTERVLGKGWRLGAAINLNQAIVNVGSSALSSPTVSRSNDKSAYVFLRYEGSSGSLSASARCQSSRRSWEWQYCGNRIF